MDALGIYTKLYILACADDETFIKIKDSDEIIHMICNDTLPLDMKKKHTNLTDFLYHTRCEQFFSKRILKIKDANINWYEFYLRMRAFYNTPKHNVFKYVFENKLIELKILALDVIPKKAIFPNTEPANHACDYGHIEILEWMKEIDYFPDIIGTQMAIYNNRIVVLDWIKKNNLPLPDIKFMNSLIQDNYLEVLDWFFKNKLSLPDIIGSNLAALHGNISSLEWMKKHNLPLHDVIGANNAAYYNRLDVIKWMKENNLTLPDKRGAWYAHKFGYDKLLEFLSSQSPPILPDPDLLKQEN